MQQLHQVHAVPTDKLLKGMLFKGGIKSEWIIASNIHAQLYAENPILRTAEGDNTEWIPHHIYFTSSEEIKSDDWVLVKNEGYKKCQNRMGKWVMFNDEEGVIQDVCRKIVAATNPELHVKADIKAYRTGSGPTIVSNIPKIGDDFLKAFVEANGNIKEVELETYQWEDCPKEARASTMGESNWGGHNIGKLKLNPDGTVKWKLKEERMIPLSSIRAFLDDHSLLRGMQILDSHIEEWFNKNYPK